MNQHPSVVFHGGKAEMMMSTTGYSVGTQVTNYNFNGCIILKMEIPNNCVTR